MTAITKVSDESIYFSSFQRMNLLTCIQSLLSRLPASDRDLVLALAFPQGIPPLSFYQPHNALRLFITQNQ